MPHSPKTYAGFWSRAAAFTLDYFVLLGYLIGLTLIFLILRQVGMGLEWWFSDRLRAQVTVILILTLPITLYFAFGESSVHQATWGKQRLRLRVIDGNGDRIHFLQALS